MTEELKLVQKCYDPEEYGYLYGFNREIPDFELEDVKQYMKKFTPASFKNVMAISGKTTKKKKKKCTRNKKTKRRSNE